MNAIQALSQLSYGPTPGSQPAPFPAKRSGAVENRAVVLVLAASSAAFGQDQAFKSRFFVTGQNGRQTIAPRLESDLVLVVADADHVGDVVVLFLFVGKEGVVIIIAEIDIVLVVAEIGKIVAATLGLVIGFLK